MTCIQALTSKFIVVISSNFEVQTNLKERILSIFDYCFRSEWVELPRWFRFVILTLLGGFWRFKDDVNIDGRASLQQHHTTAAKKVTMFLRLHAVLALLNALIKT